MTAVLATFAVAVASALIPVVNIEAYLAVAATQVPGAVLVLATAAAAGQMLGKCAWYAAGRYSVDMPRVAKKMSNPKNQARLEKWRARTEGRPLATAGLLLLSASTGIPPYAVVAVLAGLLQVSWWMFLTTGFVGRLARFAVVLGLAESLAGWFA